VYWLSELYTIVGYVALWDGMKGKWRKEKECFGLKRLIRLRNYRGVVSWGASALCGPPLAACPHWNNLVVRK
jgi:hypothetical protein